MGFYLYRHFDAGGRLLYIGLTSNPRNRILNHKSSQKTQSFWFRNVTTIKVRFASRIKDKALDMESNAIIRERPLYNKNNRKMHCPYYAWLKKFDTRKKKMQALLKRGLTLQKIADKFGLSRQRVHQIVNGK